MVAISSPSRASASRHSRWRAENDHLYGGLGADQHIGRAGIDFAGYDDANYGNLGNLTISLDDPALNVGAERLATRIQA